MDQRTQELEAWEERLETAEADLSEREKQALAQDPSPSELLAFAAERDKLAAGRDELGSAYDEHATGRDRSALNRDVEGVGRDRRARDLHEDRDPAFADRWLAGVDRDFGAGDRGDSYDDRGRSGLDRERAADDRDHAAEDRQAAGEKAAGQEKELDRLRAALESRHRIGMAQGLLMAEYKVLPEAAFAVLVRLSQHTNAKLREVAAGIVATFESERDVVGAVEANDRTRIPGDH